MHIHIYMYIYRCVKIYIHIAPPASAARGGTGALSTLSTRIYMYMCIRLYIYI